MKISSRFLFFILLLSTEGFGQLGTFLPKPTGEFFVGTQNLFFTDNSRKEKLTVRGGDKRMLQVKIWYPSDVKGETENMYLKDYSAETLWANYKVFNDSKSFFDSLKHYKTFSYENIPISNKQKSFPLIFFSQGFYFGLDDYYTALMENLASHGFIVVSITHPYDQVIANTADGKVLNINKWRMTKAYFQWKKVEWLHKKTPDTNNAKQVNRILKAYLRGMKVFRRSVNLWVKDVQFVMDTLERINNFSVGNKFYGKLDFSKVGTLGQSVGGAVSGQLCYVEDRMKAGVNLDCFQFGDLYDHEMNKPFMLMQSDSYPLWQIANKVIYSKTNPFYSIKIKNSRHFIFSDCSIFPVKFNDKLKDLVGEGDKYENVKLINEYLVDFYNHYLNNTPFKSGLFPSN
jgi:Platelet-activating factor acetylhydrolase, isoform II